MSTESTDSLKSICSMKAMSWLKPVIDFHEEKKQTEIANKLKLISASFYKYLRVESSELNKENSCEFKADFVFQHVDSFCKNQGFEEYNSQDAKLWLDSIEDLVKGKVTTENLQSILKISDMIKCCHLFKLYPMSDSCSSCNRKWTQLNKVLGERVRECLFCGNDEYL